MGKRHRLGPYRGYELVAHDHGEEFSGYARRARSGKPASVEEDFIGLGVRADTLAAVEERLRRLVDLEALKTE